MVLGTSEKMIQRIIKRLELPELERLIRIEDITSEEEREIAKNRDRSWVNLFLFQLYS